MPSLGSGAPLPSRAALSHRLARMTVRTEICRLVTEGLVYRLHGRGTFVAEPRVAQAVLFSSFSEDMRRAAWCRARSCARGADRGRPVPGGHARHEPGRSGGGVRARPHGRRHADRARARLPAGGAPAGIEEADLTNGSLFELLASRYGIELTDADQRVVAVEIADEEAELLDVEEERRVALPHAGSRPRRHAGLLRHVAVPR